MCNALCKKEDVEDAVLHLGEEYRWRARCLSSDNLHEAEAEG